MPTRHPIVVTADESSGMGHGPGRLGSPLTEPHWDDWVSEWPPATFFHRSVWLRVLESSYGYATQFVGIGAPGHWRCLFPFAEVDSRLTGRRGICLPFTDACGPLLTDPAAARTAWREILQLAQRRHWKYIEFRSDAEWLEGARPSGTFVGHSLRIDRPETELWQGLDDANRRAIRKAQRTELAVRFSADHDSVRAFYRLVCLTRRRQGLPPQPWSFFEQIQRHVLAPGKGFIVSAHYHDQMIAGAMFFRFRDLLLYKFGASDFQCQHLRANNLLMWEAIRRAGTDGVSRLDFGRTSVHHESLRRFKRSWGARELPLPYIRYDCSTSAFTTPPDRSSGWHTHLFRLLPAPLSRLLGQLLYRHVA